MQRGCRRGRAPLRGPHRATPTQLDQLTEAGQVVCARGREPAERVASSGQVILVEHDIITSPFTAAVHACVPPLPWSVAQSDIDQPGRRGPPPTRTWCTALCTCCCCALGASWPAALKLLLAGPLGRRQHPRRRGGAAQGGPPLPHRLLRGSARVQGHRRCAARATAAGWQLGGGPCPADLIHAPFCGGTAAGGLRVSGPHGTSSVRLVRA